MTSIKIPSVFHTLVILVLGTRMMVSVHGVALHHLKGCPLKDIKFPTAAKVSLNITGQSWKSESDINKRSTSPWNISLLKDHNRFPPVIAQASCNHKACVDSNGNLDLSMNSVEINQEMLVLRRELKGCNYIFKLEKMLVTVGCTCVRPERI